MSIVESQLADKATKNDGAVLSDVKNEQPEFAMLDFKPWKYD